MVASAFDRRYGVLASTTSTHAEAVVPPTQTVEGCWRTYSTPWLLVYQYSPSPSCPEKR